MSPPVNGAARVDQPSNQQEAFEAWWQACGQVTRDDREKALALKSWMAAVGGRACGQSGQEWIVQLDAAISQEDFKAIALEHCPFCGPGNSICELYFDDTAHRWRVGCGACGCSTGTDPRDKTPRPAINAWNRRG